MDNLFEYKLLDDGTVTIIRCEDRWQTIHIPDTIEGCPVTVIADEAFKGCKLLREISIPEGVRRIGSSAFRECVKLSSVTLPSSLAEIGGGAFADCLALDEISLPESLTSLGAEALRGCKSLTRIVIPEGIASLPDRALSGCRMLSCVSLPDSLETIGADALSKCISLPKIQIPPHVREIGSRAFFGCAKLETIRLPQGLKLLGDSAFYDCISLTGISLPDSLECIGRDIFFMTDKACRPPMLIVSPSSHAESYAIREKLPYAHGCVDFLYYNILPGGSAIVTRYAGSAQSVAVPALLGGHPVSSVGNLAFRFGKTLAAVSLPEGVERIGKGAFEGCTALAQVSLPGSLREIGADAFKGCTALSSIAIPAGVTQLGGYAFYGCAALTELSLPDGLAEIGSFTFCDCASLASVSMHAGLQKIGMSAFNGCKALRSVTLPESLTAIGMRAFKNCASLTEFSIPDGVREIGVDAFALCPSVILRAGEGSRAAAYAAQTNTPFVPASYDRDPAFSGAITARMEFLFPDTPLAVMPDQVHVASARNGKVGVQILFDCPQAEGSVRVIGPDFDVEMYQMLDVPVEYNTGNGVDQGGAMVLLPDECPDYAIRKAPFRVYDCLRPTDSSAIPAKDGRVSAYVSFAPKEGVTGERTLYLELSSGARRHICRIVCKVYPVVFDEDLFKTTNWFSVCEMEKRHSVRRGTSKFDAVVRAYARSMRRMHQKVFLLWMHEDLSERRTQKPYHFDFEDMKPIIEIFFDEGFDTFETGGILCRGYREDGSPDMYTADLKCSANPSVSVDSAEGYALLCAEMQAFSEFLTRNGWQDRVLFHVMDEPDVHYKTEADLQARRTQFFLAANIVRRYLPGVKIIEAVKTTLLRGGVDVMAPITDSYQRDKAAFDALIAMGDEVWTYVCCAPEGKWLNRFLDQPLMNGRLLFWGCAANRLRGYLHWGFNQFGGVPDPFTATSARNWTGIGTDFPCGDAFIVYPGDGGPWPSMRLEAARIGAQEAAMLRALCERDEEAHDALIAEVFTAFDMCDCDPEKLERAHEELLQLLSRP